MKINLLSVLFSVSIVGSLSISSEVYAEGLDLSSGVVQVVDNKTISLQNIAVDNRFYNAEIELRLDGTYRVKSAEQLDISSTARYQVEFISTWSAVTHPHLYPSGFSHFSGLIGATHNRSIHFWNTGEIATSGIERMAESGSKSVLQAEVKSAIDDGSAEILLSGGGIGSSPGMVSLDFEISQAYPFVTLVSMIAPSPDWFVGVSALNMIINGQWIEELVIPLYAYDAGTDSGINYTSANSDTQPTVITRLQNQPFLVDGDIPSLGHFTFRRLAE